MAAPNTELALRMLLFLSSEGQAQRGIVKTPAKDGSGRMKVEVWAGWGQIHCEGDDFEKTLTDALDAYDEDNR